MLLLELSCLVARGMLEKEDQGMFFCGRASKWPELKEEIKTK
jgi:hypothetical protein